MSVKLTEPISKCCRHRDEEKPNAWPFPRGRTIKMFFALSDVGENGGPLAVVRLGHAAVASLDSASIRACNARTALRFILAICQMVLPTGELSVPLGLRVGPRLSPTRIWTLGDHTPLVPVVDDVGRGAPAGVDAQSREVHVQSWRCAAL